LRWLAKNNASAFAGLLGKVLPSTIESPGENGEHAVNVITWNVVDPKAMRGTDTPLIAPSDEVRLKASGMAITGTAAGRRK
jgi:hypothetical protein